MKLDGKVAIITGGGSGLGRESSLLFSSEGAKVVVFDINADRADATVKLVAEQGGQAVAVHGDVRVEADVKRGVETAVAEFGKLDIMFANAGIVSRGGVPSVLGGEHLDFQDFPEEDWHKVIDTNLTGVFLCAKHAVPALRANGGGTIIATSSAASFAAYHSISPYSASKAGVNGLVRGLSLDLGKYGIRVNALAPTHGMSPNFLMDQGADVVGQSYEQMQVAMQPGPWDPGVSPIPLKVGRPPAITDNAKVALFLASDDSGYMSGVVLPSTDGGTLARVAIQFEEDTPHPWYDQEG
ncbi:SDR family NAD(P)-dependent oxidoreductase [Actinomycetospora sp. TBRC 11914]|uniref:SDR family NAD(P)-dependent oxidoreductase n=1 Tax=Actinomycetospora sp. TBRC 11914 TaxID=2729387 RepID=UPI00145D57F4|nr:SDR family NAD(P)-dependent oxidoreductase [Actinomycetospora sp. TBRC 11914]NMO91612.1 SDR family oxidoreductase [Actinomycetospora sp. TBRC 11914]